MVSELVCGVVVSMSLVLGQSVEFREVCFCKPLFMYGINKFETQLCSMFWLNTPFKMLMLNWPQEVMLCSCCLV